MSNLISFHFSFSCPTFLSLLLSLLYSKFKLCEIGDGGAYCYSKIILDVSGFGFECLTHSPLDPFSIEL